MAWNLCPRCNRIDDGYDGKNTNYGIFGSMDHTECRKELDSGNTEQAYRSLVDDRDYDLEAKDEKLC